MEFSALEKWVVVPTSGSSRTNHCLQGIWTGQKPSWEEEEDIQDGPPRSRPRPDQPGARVAIQPCRPMHLKEFWARKAWCREWAFGLSLSTPRTCRFRLGAEVLPRGSQDAVRPIVGRGSTEQLKSAGISNPQSRSQARRPPHACAKTLQETRTCGSSGATSFPGITISHLSEAPLRQAKNNFV